MNIRKITDNDIENVAQLLADSYNINTKEEGIKIIKFELQKDHKYILAEENNKIIGLITWTTHGLPKHELAELDRIVVIKEFRGKGVSKKLFDALIQDAKNEYKKYNKKLRKLYILTHKDNKPAQAFYEKMGCKHETTLKSHFYKDLDEYVYSKFF